MFRVLAAVLLAASLGLAVPAAEAAQRDHRHNTVTVKALPKGHHKVTHRGKSYFYSAGRFYRHNKGAYVSIVAPLGAIVPVLPNGYISFGIGSRRHFYFEGTYYRQAQDGYVVVEKPTEAEDELAYGSDKLMIYPAAGQTDEQRDRDRYECHAWSSDEAHFDPSDGDSDPMLRADYDRAMEACMLARDYVVR